MEQNSNVTFIMYKAYVLYGVKMSEKDKAISFWTILPESYYRKVRSLCALKGCNLRDFAKEIIMTYIDSLEVPKQEEGEGKHESEPREKAVNIEA